MRAIEINGQALEINWTNALTAGHGHKKITVELYFDGKYEKFAATTNNMPDYDDATDLEGEDKDEALFNLIAYKIEDQIMEWIQNQE